MIFKTCVECEQRRYVPTEIKPKGRKCCYCKKRQARAYAKAHYQRNRETVLANVKAYREANPEKVNQAKRRHYRDNREEIRARQAAYQRTHKAEAAARSRRYYERHRDEIRARSVMWAKTNPERKRESIRKWYAGVRADPVRYRMRLENARMSERLRAEREGRQMRTLSQDQYEQRYGPASDLVSTEPLVSALSIATRELGLGMLSRRAEVPTHQIFDIIHGKQKRTTLDTADRLCTAFGLPLSAVYVDER